jgi:ElaB/YqjD/DUF883 family membrane-anchored ribosome-binding protein
MKEENAKTEEVPRKIKTNARGEVPPTTYRTVLIAASVGLLIGLLLKR